MSSAISVQQLSVRFRGRGRDAEVVALQPLDFDVDGGRITGVLGPNGSGKTTLLRVAAMLLHPTTGTVEVLGETLGRTDVRTLRTRIGIASAALAAELRPDVIAADVVMTAKYAALEPWWHTYDEGDRARATELIEQVGCGHLVGQRFGLASSGVSP